MRNLTSIIAGVFAATAVGAFALAVHGRIAARPVAGAHLEARRTLIACEAELGATTSALARAEEALATARQAPPAAALVPAADDTSRDAAARQAAADEAAKAAAFKAAIAEMRRATLASRLVTLELHLRPRFERLGLAETLWEPFEMLAADSRDGADAERSRAAMRALVGDAGFEDLVAHDGRVNDPARILAQELASALLFTDAPLAPEQFETAAALFAQHGIARDGQPSPPPGAHAPVSAALARVLTPEQLATWSRLAAARELDAQLAAQLQGRR